MTEKKNIATCSDLTPKQESFAQHYVLHGNATAAYRESYNVRPNTQATSIWQGAKQLLDHPKISSRIAELRAAVAEQAVVSLEKHLATLADIRDKAAQAGHFGAAISAEIARGKAAGLYVEKKEVRASVMTVIEIGDES